MQLGSLIVHLYDRWTAMSNRRSSITPRPEHTSLLCRPENLPVGSVTRSHSPEGPNISSMLQSQGSGHHMYPRSMSRTRPPPVIVDKMDDIIATSDSIETLEQLQASPYYFSVPIPTNPFYAEQWRKNISANSDSYVSASSVEDTTFTLHAAHPIPGRALKQISYDQLSYLSMYVQDEMFEPHLKFERMRFQAEQSESPSEEVSEEVQRCHESLMRVEETLFRISFVIAQRRLECWL